MKSSFTNRFLNRSSAALASAVIAQCLPAAAQSGTWSGLGAGPNNWSASGQWSASTVANGAGNTAGFTSNITGLTVVTLDSTRSIGNVTFSDNAAGGSPWLLRGSNTLTMDNGASQAVITKTTTTTISTPIAGSNIRFNGNAVINLLGNNTGITGTVTLGGTNGVNIGNSNAFGSASISHVNGEVLGGTTRGIAISNPFTLGTYYWQGGFGLTLNGTLTLTGANQGFQTFAAITDTVQAGAVSLGANTLNVQGGAVGGLRISGNISGTGGVAKSGSSALTLSGSNSYTGATNVTAGRLNFNATANTSDISTSNTGSILGGEGSSSNAITLGTGTILAFDPATPASLSTAGTLSIPGAVTLALEPTLGLAAGVNVVDVVTYGSFNGLELANLSLPSGIRSGLLIDDTANSKITLTLETGTRTWEGSAALPYWDSLTTGSWIEGDKNFAAGDSVVFDDTATAAGNISVVGKLTPASVTFNNSSLDYTLVPVDSTPNANEITGGTSLVKSGTGLVTITNTNSYTGGTSIDAGTLSFVNGGLGTYGSITMNGGTLKWEGANTQDISRRLALVNGKAATFEVGGTSSVNFNTTLGGSTATTASVVKNGSGTLNLANSFSPGTYTGGTTVNSGTLSLGTGGTGNFTCAPEALGTGLVTINTGARVRLWIQNTQTHAIPNNFALDGGRLHAEDGIYNVNGTVSVASGGATFSAVYGGKNLYLNGVISGSGPVTVEPNAAQIRFLNNNTFTGATTLSSGSLLLNGTNVSSGYSLASGTNLILRSASLTGNISGPGNVTKDINFYGASSISGTNSTYTGTTIVNIDRFTLASGGVINGTSSITVLGQWDARYENFGSTTTPGAVSINGYGGNGGAATTGIFYNGNVSGTTPGTLNAASLTLGSSFRSAAASLAKGGELINHTSSTVNLGSGAITVNGQGNALAGGMLSAGSTFANAGSVTAGSLTLNSSSTANTASNKGGTFTQTAGTTTLSDAATLSANGGTGAAGTAGNDAALNLTGGTLNLPTLALNSGTLTATGGTLTLGATGLTSTGANTISANFGATTLAASAAWSSAVSATLTDVATGTTVDTTGGDIALSGALDGSGKLNKAGTGTLVLSGPNTYVGATAVNGGTLALSGAGTIADSASVTIAAGTQLDTTAKTGTYTLAGETIAFGLDSAGGGTSGRIDADALAISGASVSFNISGPLDDSEYVLASYTSLTGTFAVAPPAGYAFDYGTGSNSQIKLVQGGGYDSWIDSYTFDPGADKTRTGDPDGDGFNNLQEFLFGTAPNAGDGSLTTTEKSGGTLIIRWKERTSGATYTLKESPTLLNDWINSSAPVTNDGAAAGDYQPRRADVTIGSGKLFFRVEGTEVN